jgi:hypothetical protein
MHTALDLLLVGVFFLLLKFGLSCEEFLFPFVSGFHKSFNSSRSKPTSNSTLDIKSGLFSFLSPHRAAKISLWVYNFIVSTVNVQTSSFHLGTLLAHHMSRFGLVLVGLYKTFVFIWMIVGDLVSLRKSVVVSNTRTVVSEATKVRLGSLLLFDVHCNYFDLVVGKSNFYFELVWHNEFISFD